MIFLKLIVFKNSINIILTFFICCCFVFCVCFVFCFGFVLMLGLTSFLLTIPRYHFWMCWGTICGSMDDTEVGYLHKFTHCTTSLEILKEMYLKSTSMLILMKTLSVTWYGTIASTSVIIHTIKT